MPRPIVGHEIERMVAAINGAWISPFVDFSRYIEFGFYHSNEAACRATQVEFYQIWADGSLATREAFFTEQLDESFPLLSAFAIRLKAKGLEERLATDICRRLFSVISEIDPGAEICSESLLATTAPQDGYECRKAIETLRASYACLNSSRVFGNLGHPHGDETDEYIEFGDPKSGVLETGHELYRSDLSRNSVGVILALDDDEDLQSLISYFEAILGQPAYRNQEDGVWAWRRHDGASPHQDLTVRSLWSSMAGDFGLSVAAFKQFQIQVDMPVLRITSDCNDWHSLLPLEVGCHEEFGVFPMEGWHVPEVVGSKVVRAVTMNCSRK